MAENVLKRLDFARHPQRRIDSGKCNFALMLLFLIRWKVLQKITLLNTSVILCSGSQHLDRLDRTLGKAFF